ncbi:MAG: hypothetical protein ACXVPD_01295 [Bacteroidia bacterium]
MKLFFASLFCLFISVGYSQLNNVIYVTDTVPAMDADVQSALNVYKLRFESGNETDLLRNFDTYRLMDSLYGKSWIKKLKTGMGEHKVWADFVSKPKIQTVYVDNWNWTKYEYYSVGLLKSVETKTCGYNLRCGLKTKEYSRTGKVTANKLKNISKDEK